MPIKTLLIASALTVLPTLALAMGGCSARGHQAQSCAPGTVWDANTQSCVEQASS